MPFILVVIALPFICGIMYRWGGSDQWEWCPIHQGLWRSMIGIPIAAAWATQTKSWIPLVCILTYWFQPPYGANSYLNFLGEWGKWAFCGFVFGISSTPVWLATPWWWMSLVMGFTGMLSFVFVHWLNKKGKIQNPWEERVRGFLATIPL